MRAISRRGLIVDEKWSLQIFLYIGGVLLAFAVLAAIAFRQLFVAHETTQSRELIIASTIHLIATLGSLGATHLITRTTITSVIPAKGGISSRRFPADVDLQPAYSRAYRQRSDVTDIERDRRWLRTA
jgi:hypothetical protein